jgi:hypothetical protein
MKTTINITPYKRIVMEDNKTGHVNFEIVQGLRGGPTTSELHIFTLDKTLEICTMMAFLIEQQDLAAAA